MTIDYAVGQRLTATLLQQLADYTVNRPLVRLVATSAQALADNTATAIQFGVGSDIIDTHDFHNESSNNTRITPSIPGVYRFSGSVLFEGQTTAVVSNAFLRLNGATSLAPAGRGTPPGTLAFGLSTTLEQEMNGSTDYMELVGQQDSAGADNTNQSSQFSCVFECEFLRPL